MIINEIFITSFLTSVLVFTPAFAEPENTNDIEVNKNYTEENIIDATINKVNPYINMGDAVNVNDGRNGVVYSGGLKLTLGKENQTKYMSSRHTKKKTHIKLHNAK